MLRRRAFGLGSALVLSVTLIAPVSQAFAADDPATTLKTVGGMLRVQGDIVGSKRVALNKKTVTEIPEDDHIAFDQKFSIGGNDVVLVRSNCGGSSCSYSTLNFITVSPSGKVTVSEGIAAGEEGADEVKQIANTVTLKATTAQGRRTKTTTWIYTDGMVAKSK